MGREEDRILGIDLGTSSCKIIITDALGRIIDTESDTYTVHSLPNGGAEQDPEEWWRAIVSATSRVMERRTAEKENVVGVGVTAQWSGTVPVDKNGKQLRNAIIWMDTRGEPYVRELIGGFPSISGYRLDKLLSWIRKTGGAPARSGKDSIAHILFLKNEEPEVYRETFKFLEPKDYVNLRLTGNFFGSYDDMVVHWATDNRRAETVRYDRSLLKLSTLDPEKLPPLKQSMEIIGGVTRDASEELGIPAGTKVVGGAGDMQASLIGSGCTEYYQYHLYLGTSSWLTTHFPRKKTDIAHNIASLPSAIPGRYFVAAEQESAGNSLEFIRRILFGGAERPSEGHDYKEMDKLAAEAAAGSQGLIFAPWLYGERTPVEESHLRGAFINMSLRTGRECVARSVLEGVAYNMKWLLDTVETFCSHLAEPIRFGGGGANSPLWSQILSDVLRRRIMTVANPTSTTARGAALLAAVGLGLTSWEELPAAIPIIGEYTPDPERAKTYEQRYKHFKQFYSRNKKLFFQMNRRN